MHVCMKTYVCTHTCAGPGTLPCNMRMYPEQDGRSIVPDLAGPVAVLDNKHEVRCLPCVVWLHFCCSLEIVAARNESRVEMVIARANTLPFDELVCTFVGVVRRQRFSASSCRAATAPSRRHLPAQRRLRRGNMGTRTSFVRVRCAPHWWQALFVGTSASCRAESCLPVYVLCSPRSLFLCRYWKLLPTGPCGVAPENAELYLECPDPTTTTIKSVKFASFGTPTGNCTTGFAHNPECDDVDPKQTLAKVESACVGKSSCSIVANTDIFGDGCEGTVKSLAVEVACA